MVYEIKRKAKKLHNIENEVPCKVGFFYEKSNLGTVRRGKCSTPQEHFLFHSFSNFYYQSLLSFNVNIYSVTQISNAF